MGFPVDKPELEALGVTDGVFLDCEKYEDKTRCPDAMLAPHFHHKHKVAQRFRTRYTDTNIISCDLQGPSVGYHAWEPGSMSLGKVLQWLSSKDWYFTPRSL
ncbi:hypothetical protein AG1IA_01484 [Rhizoctonia solani AG-1 IA]|uniref:Uncharacterized protein n=1 Tax=Thanatephorus cucumeris (strain AG1-IA) TaxID=983506 RepID=L8X5W1_THACA|nr:hypothetical protein AG1IA_01484 [Rhizoctonia solani AG-1 IA]